MKRYVPVAAVLLVAALIFGAHAAITALQWGVDRTTSPWTTCIYDQNNVCQGAFTIPATGGGVLLPSTRGGTGVNNGASTITLGGNLTTSGAFPLIVTLTGSTNVTFPTSGTLATTTSPAASIVVGTTAITGGSSGKIEFNNAGILGEYSISGTGSVCMTSGCAIDLGSATNLPATALPAGVAANVLLTKTSNYTIASGDCGKTIQTGTGSSGNFTITLPSVSGFPATCTVAVLNGDTSARKTLSGFPSGSPVLIAANDVIDVSIVNGAWSAPTNAPTADAYFTSGRPWCDVKSKGAVGNAVADDTAAIQSCINTIQALGGGIVYVSAGNYCAPTGLSITSGAVWLYGAYNTEIQSCAGTATLLTVNYPASKVTGLTFAGPQLAAGVAPTTDTLSVGSNCTKCVFEDLIVNFGRFPINNASADSPFYKVQATFGYGSAILYNTFSLRAKTLKLDQNFPISTPAFPLTAPSAWQSAHAYTGAGTLVSTGGFYIQLSSASCTSGGGAPTVLNYGTAITDNTCSWFLAMPTTYYALQVDTGASAVFCTDCDFSANTTANVAMTNTLAGTAPQSVFITNSSFGLALAENVLGAAGSNLNIIGGNIQNCILVGCSGVNLNSAWVGDFKSTGAVYQGHTIGVSIGAGSNNSITGGQISNETVEGVLVAANINQFNVQGVLMGSSPLWGANAKGVVVAAGTSDNYNITEINCGALTQANCVSDGGTGTHKNVNGNTAPIVGDPSYTPGSIGGLGLANDGGTPNSIMDIAAGAATDTTNAVFIKIGAFTKSTAGVWAAGTGANGMGNGLTIANATWYSVCLAYNGGTPDIYFDTSVTCANKPAGVSGALYRVIGFFKTNGSALIVPGTWRAGGVAIEFDWTTVVTDVNTTVGTTATAFTLPSVPNGVSVNALIRGTITKAAAIPSAIIYPTSETGTTAVASPTGNRNIAVQTSGGTTSAEFNIPTNASQQVEVVSDTAATQITMVTRGYVYAR